MLVGPPPPPQPTVVVVERVQTPPTKTLVSGNSVNRPPKVPGHGAVALGMFDNEPEKEEPKPHGFFVTHVSERSRARNTEAPITEIADTFPKFRTALDAESQIEADQDLLKQTADLKSKLALAQRIDHTYKVLFELREKERQGLSSSVV